MCELKQRMPYSEFVLQFAFHQQYPWGDDWRQTQALSASMISASPKFKRIDLKPYFPKPAKSQPMALDGLFQFASQQAIENERKRRGE